MQLLFKSSVKKFSIIIASLLVLAAGCESMEWRQAKEQNTIQAYENYLEEYPEGEHSQEARSRLIGVSAKDAKQKNTVQAYQEFLERFPRAGRLRTDILRNLEVLIEGEVEKLTPGQMKKMTVVIETGFGTIRFEFFPQAAPGHCRNFIKLARTHFYDHLWFHLVIPDVLIQTGAPKGNIMGGPGYTIPPEFNDRPHLRGTVAMYHGEHPNDAGSQFYICLKDLPHLDGNYTVFGKVKQGMDVADKIAAVPNSGPPKYRPQKRVFIKQVSIQEIE